MDKGCWYITQSLSGSQDDGFAPSFEVLETEKPLACMADAERAAKKLDLEEGTYDVICCKDTLEVSKVERTVVERKVTRRTSEPEEPAED